MLERKGDEVEGAQVEERNLIRKKTNFEKVIMNVSKRDEKKKEKT